jgi:flagellar assembly protein FliH
MTSHTRHALPDLEGQAAAGSAPVLESMQSAVPSYSNEMIESAIAAEFERGRAQGRAEAESECSDRLRTESAEEAKRLEVLLQSMGKQVENLGEQRAKAAYRFALAVAARIVRREVSIDDNVVLRTIQESLRRVAGVENIRVRLNPGDEAIVRAHRTMLLTGTDSIHDFVIEPDEKVEQGGCILETGSGTVDARLASQLEQIEMALFGQIIS